MANKNNENKKAAAETAVVTNASNIYEALDKAVVATDESLPAKAMEQLQQESDENTIRNIKRRFQKAQYTIDNGFLKKRRQKELDKISTNELTMVDRIARFLMGFTVTDVVIEHAKHCPDTLFNIEKVDEKAKTITITMDGKDTTYKMGETVPAVIDYVDYDEYLDKIRKEIRKQTSEAESTYDKYANKLKAKYGEYWDHSWWY